MPSIICISHLSSKYEGKHRGNDQYGTIKGCIFPIKVFRFNDAGLQGLDDKLDRLACDATRYLVIKVDAGRLNLFQGCLAEQVNERGENNKPNKKL